jgi:hypothetical protein
LKVSKKEFFQRQDGFAKDSTKHLKNKLASTLQSLSEI